MMQRQEPLEGDQVLNNGMPWNPTLADRCVKSGPMEQLGDVVLLPAAAEEQQGDEQQGDEQQQLPLDPGEAAEEGQRGGGGLVRRGGGGGGAAAAAGGGTAAGGAGAALPLGRYQRRDGKLLGDEFMYPLLCKQLEHVIQFYSTPYNPRRDCQQCHSSTLTKIRLVVQAYLGHAESHHRLPRSEVRLEQLLSAKQVGRWLRHVISERRCAPRTITTYLSSFQQALKALRGMGAQHANGADAIELIANLAAISKQAARKGDQRKAQQQMARAVAILDASAMGRAEDIADLPGPLRHAAAMHHASLTARLWLPVCEAIPQSWWHDAHGALRSQLMLVAREAFAAWWRCLQVGVDLSPLRPSLMMGLHMYTPGNRCRHESCFESTCKGNRIEVNELGGATIYLVHHKAASRQSGLLSGSLAPRLPPGSLTGRLTALLMRRQGGLLEWLHQARGSFDQWDDLKNPILWDFWAGGGDALDQFAAGAGLPMGDTLYSKRWRDVGIGLNCLVPVLDGHRHQKSHGGWLQELATTKSLRMEALPFPLAPYVPSDCRKMFATSLLHFGNILYAELSRSSEVSPLLKDLMSRSQGHRSDTMTETYDLLLRVSEAECVQQTMLIMRRLLQEELANGNWRNKTRQRLRLQHADLTALRLVVVANNNSRQEEEGAAGTSAGAGTTTQPQEPTTRGEPAAAGEQASGAGSNKRQREGGWLGWILGRKRGRQ